METLVFIRNNTLTLKKGGTYETEISCEVSI